MFILFFIVFSKGHYICYSRSLFRVLGPIILQLFFCSLFVFISAHVVVKLDTRVRVVFIILISISGHMPIFISALSPIRLGSLLSIYLCFRTLFPYALCFCYPALQYYY